MVIKLFANLREIAGTGVIEKDIAEKVELKEILHDLASKYGSEMMEFLFDKEMIKISDYITIFINGKQINKENQILLNNQDEMSILLPLAGG